MTIAAVILAAGEGRRLGLGPKAHVEIEGESFLARVVGTCREAGIARILVVGSPQDARIEAACAALGIAFVQNPDPARGMSSSVNVGLAAAQASGAVDALVFPVDHPFVRASTVASLAAAARDDAWVRPVREGRHGHPIAVGASVMAGVLALGPGVPLREALEAVGARRIDLASDDLGVVRGVDAIGDLG